MSANRHHLMRFHQPTALAAILSRSWKPASFDTAQDKSAGFAQARARFLRQWSTRTSLLALASVWLFPAAAGAQVQVTAAARPNAVPAWSKGLQPISAESYYHAIECGKQGGDDPPCVFWDTGLCKNDDFTLAWYSAYKEVAYQVWTAVRKKQPAPQPSYQSAQRTRVTIGVTRAPGSKNTLTDFVVKRGGKPVPSVSRSVATGQFTYDYPAWAPTARVTIEMVGKTRTVSCVIPAAVLAQLR